MSSLRDKAVLLTGAAGGIGAATARLMAERGAQLWLTDANAPTLETLARALRDEGAVAHAHPCDLGDAGAVAAMVQAGAERFGQLDVVVNNAAALGPHMGPTFDRDVETTELEVWDEAWRINVRGLVLVCRGALPHLVAAGGGAVVNVASNLALQGNTIQNAYSATKAAVLQITRCIAASHGRRGVRCNAVLPGLTLTPVVREHMPEALKQEVVGETLLGRLGRPEEIAATIAFLASDESSNLTGPIIACDGGLSTHVPGCFAHLDATASDPTP